ncbi:MAG: MFS transporter [Sphingobium sp.]|nr:MAG: MFS transporter [Sphingobium sp.]
MHALRVPIFRYYLAANTFSYIGNWVERLSLSWIAWQMSGSALWTGLVAVGHLIPAAFLGPIFGALTERWEMRRAAIWLNSLLALMSASLFVVVITLHPPVQFLAAAALMIGVPTALNQPVRLVLVSQMIPAAALSSATRLAATSYNLSRVLGPAVAGLLIARFNADWSLAANPLSYLPLLAVFVAVRLQPHAPNGQAPRSLLASILDGIRYIRRDHLIAWCMLVTATNALLARGVLEIIPVIVGKLLKGDSALLATVTSVSGAGAIIASVLASSVIPNQANAKKITSLAALAGGVAIIAAGAAPTTMLTALAIGLISFSATLSSINSQSLVYVFADSAYRARTLTWWSTFSLGASAGGGVLLSSLAELVPFSWVLTATGAIALFAASALFATRPAGEYR